MSVVNLLQKLEKIENKNSETKTKKYNIIVRFL